MEILWMSSLATEIIIDSVIDYIEDCDPPRIIDKAVLHNGQLPTAAQNFRTNIIRVIQVDIRSIELLSD